MKRGVNCGVKNDVHNNVKGRAGCRLAFVICAMASGKAYRREQSEVIEHYPTDGRESPDMPASATGECA